MAASSTSNSTKSSLPVPIEPGKVGEVRNQFLLQGDEGLAQRMQDEEFGVKYNWNREERRQARTDVPLARIVQTEEEKRLEIEQLERLEREKERADMDARIAMQLEREERMRKDLNTIERNDNRLAKEIQRQESQHVERTQDDAILALQMQREELLRKRNEARQRELEDQNLALRLQQRERQLAEMARVERELRQQQLLLNNPPVALAGNGHIQGNALHRRLQLAEDDDDEFVTEGNHYDALYAQDQDMAREMQQLEIEQAKATRRAARDHACDLASSDARLARIMQEQERLDAIRRAEERRIRRLRRLQMEQQMAMLDENDMIGIPSPPPYDQTPQVPGHRHHVERAPLTHSRSVDPYLNRAQSSRVGTVTYLPSRSSQSVPVSSTPVLPSDFLRYDEPPLQDVVDAANSSSQYRYRGEYIPDRRRPNSIATRSQSVVGSNDEPQLPYPRAKRSESTKCKQQ